MRDYLHAAFSVHSRRSHIGQDFLNPLSLLHSINQLTLFLRQQLPFPATKPMVFWIALVPCREKDWLLSDFASRLVYLKTSPALTGIELSQLDLVPKGRKGVSVKPSGIGFRDLFPYPIASSGRWKDCCKWGK